MTLKNFDIIKPGDILENLELPPGHELKFGVVIMTRHQPGLGRVIDATDFNGHVWVWDITENLKVRGDMSLEALKIIRNGASTRPKLTAFTIYKQGVE